MDRTQTKELIARKRARKSAPASPPVIAIAGMHRSGTSMVARLLQSCGLNLGPEADLAPAKPDNPDGFWENTNFVDINDEVLSAIGAGWDLPRPFPSAWKENRYLRRTQAKAELLISSFRGTEPWGWKDPRNSVTAEFWLSVLPKLRFIVCLRNPLEVAVSLQNRNFFSYEMALTLWAVYNQRLVESVPPRQRLVVHYDAFFRRPAVELRRMLEFARIEASETAIRDALAGVKPQLRHGKFTTRHLLDAELSSDILKLYATLATEAGWTNGKNAVARLEQKVKAQSSTHEPARLLHDHETGDGAHQPVGRLDRSAFELELLKRRIRAAAEELDHRGARIRELELLLSSSAEPLAFGVPPPPDLLPDEIPLLPGTAKQPDATESLRLVREQLAILEAQSVDDSSVLALMDQPPANDNIETQFHRLRAAIIRLRTRLAELSTQKSHVPEQPVRALETLRIPSASESATEERLIRQDPAVIEELKKKLQERVRETEELRHQLSASLDEMGTSVEEARRIRERIAQLETRGGEIERENALFRDALIVSRGELERIHRSRLWKIGTAYWRALRLIRLLPGSPAPLSSSALPGLQAERAGGAEAARSESAAEIRQPISSSSATAEPADAKEQAAVPAVFTNLLDDFERRFNRRPSILNWKTRIDLAAVMPHEMIFGPIREDETLPYLDGSVDIVVIPADAREIESEARRVAAAALVKCPWLNFFKPDLENARVEWMEGASPSLPVSVSIIIPVFNHARETHQCLVAVKRTLPPDFAGEIIVVDDASFDETPRMLADWAQGDSQFRLLRNHENRGFIDSCNAGAEIATGEVLVFLNNDTVPQPGWLNALLQTFSRYPDTGAVGSKLLYPNGTLQEAGGRVFSDASALNFGKRDPHADAPLYSFVREVDYCSGAALATPRSLFRALKGFDTRFRPAYYEDVDYCFSVRKAGYKVMFQPDSKVVHLEGVTSGRDITEGPKQYQELNREKFHQKWSAELLDRPLPPSTISYPVLHRLYPLKKTRRALFINHTVPEYDREGGSRRLFHLIEFLREEDWAVSFMAPWVPWGERYERELQQMGVATYRKGLAKLGGGEPYETEAERLIATGKFDAAIISFWHIAETWAPVIRKHSASTRLFIDSIDLHFLRQARAAFRKAGDDGDASLNTKYGDEMRRELNTYKAADAVLTVSEKEALLINDFTSNPRLAFAVPESEASINSPLGFSERKGILFIGSFRHPPNAEAVQFLFNEILPLIDPKLLAEHPVYIVGTDPTDEIRALAEKTPGVHLTGWVPSVEPYLRKARISVLPLLNGAGTKTKLIQALIAGIPSVSTTIGAEGLPVKDEEHVLIANRPADFAHGIERLMVQEDLWQKLAARGKADVELTHGRPAGKRKFLEVLDTVLN